MNQVIISGDTCTFNPAFSGATVTVPSTTITGTGTTTISGKPICLQSDIASVITTGTAVFPSGHTGSCTVTIKSLSSNQLSSNVTGDSQAIIKKGSQFIAEASVPTAAHPTANPIGPLTLTGSGAFAPANTTTTVL